MGDRMARDEEAGAAASGERLRFRDGRGASWSAWIAVALILLIAGWFASGMLSVDEDPARPADSGASAPVSVAVRSSTAGTVADVFVAEGQAIPDRETAVRAEASGELDEVAVEKGARLEEGEVIARFDAAPREADLRRAKAEVERAARDFANAQTLQERGAATLDRVAQTRAALAAAEAQLAAAEEALANTVIRAPFDGRLEDLRINPGEFVSAGAEVGRIVDNTPLTVRGRIPQQSVARIRAGQTAQVSFITGETREGTVTFVGTNADPGTRTFLLEVRVPNEDGAIPAGVSAEIRIETGQVEGHIITPALLALDERAALGLKPANDENGVEFYEVEVVRSQSDGVWVRGLPEEVRIITVGQGFVRAGERVDPRPDDRALTASGADAP